MAYYSDEVIEEVRAANDIVDVISGYVHLQKRGSNYVGLCPFHNDKNPSFSVSRDKQMYYCFACHAGGTVLNFLEEYENLTFQEALQSLADRARIKLPERDVSGEKRAEADRRTKLLTINREAARYFYGQLRSPQGEHALAYFQKRGLTEETIRRFGLGYSNKYSNDLYLYLKKKGYPDDLLKDSGLVTLDEKRGGCDRFWNRAMFPIMDVNSKVIGFGGRVMGDGEPKYLNSPETDLFKKSRTLYGLHIARKSRRPGILLCEGYMDVISLHQAGFDNAVAALGTAFTSGHANVLRRYTKEIYVTLDCDEAGIRAALRALPILREAGLSARVVDLQPCKDPDEFIGSFGVEEYQKRIDGAENSFLFEVRILSQDYDLDDPESKTDFFRKVAGMLCRFEEPLERENYIEAVARLYPVGFEQLKAMVGRESNRIDLSAAGRPNRAAAQEAKKKDDSVSLSESMLLTWLVDDPSVFDAVSRVIGPEDFTDEICRRAAEELFAQQARGELNPARIVDMFPDEEQQRAAAGAFHARLPSREDPIKRKKALNETVRRVKLGSIDERAAHLETTDVAGMQKLIEEKKQLENIHITID